MTPLAHIEPRASTKYSWCAIACAGWASGYTPLSNLMERCAVRERERAGLYMRHAGLLEEIRDLSAYKKAAAPTARAFKAARPVEENKAAAREGSSDAPLWPVGGARRMQKSRALERLWSFQDMECIVQQQGGGWEVNVNRRGGPQGGHLEGGSQGRRRRRQRGRGAHLHAVPSEVGAVRARTAATALWRRQIGTSPPHF